MMQSTTLKHLNKSSSNTLLALLPLLLIACQSPGGGTVGGNPATIEQNNTETAQEGADTTQQNSETPEINNNAAEPDAEPVTPDVVQPSVPQISQDAFAPDSPTRVGELEHAELTEVSGMAASTRSANTFWAINDSGNAAKLFAFSHTGKSLGEWTLDANNRDWEDMASVWSNGESYLLIADIGDNLRVKDEHAIYLFSEPLVDGNTSGPLRPVNTIRFRYPDNAHNAEAMAVSGNWIYILTKEPLLDGEPQASQVYRIPLDITPASLRTAERIAQLDVPTQGIQASIIAALAGVDVSQPTAFDIDEANRNAYLLTYRGVFKYTRSDDNSWADVLGGERVRIHGHSLAQAEALAVAQNGVVWFTSESRPAPLWALPASQ